jgi:hypothetical protein
MISKTLIAASTNHFDLESHRGNLDEAGGRALFRET